MRKDLNKQLCERERRGGYRKHHAFRRAKAYQPDWDVEDGGGPKSEGMKRRYGYNGKDFNENLKPLQGQVRKAVGRPWNKFYSELCQVFDKRSVINQHILQHLYDFISIDVYEDEEGVLRLRDPVYKNGKLSESFIEYYVDPRDGIIKRNRAYRTWRTKSREREKLARKQREAIFRELPDGSVLHLINDVWFHFTKEDAPIGWFEYVKPPGKDLFKTSWMSSPKPWERLSELERVTIGHKTFRGQTARDCLTGEHVFTERGNPTVRYHASKRTASHKLLKKAGVVE